MMHKGIIKVVVVSSVFVLSGCCGSASYRAQGSYRAGTQRPAEQSQPPVVQQPTQPAQPAQPTRPTRPTRPAEPGPHGGRGVPVVNPNPSPEPPEDLPPFGTTEPLDNALTGNIYFLPETTQRLPDLTRMQPVGQVYTRRIDIPQRRFEEGFPGVSERFEWFAIRYTGRVAFATSGTYTFRLKSDDGARLYIDGVLVVDNDGVHALQERTGTINLSAGPHDVVIEYFQGPRYQIALQLLMTPPGGREAIFSLE